MTALKSCVLALLLANLGYFVWTREFAAPADADSGVSTRVSNLKLASEVPQLASVHSASSEALHEDSAEGVNFKDKSAAPVTAAENSPDDMSQSLLTNVKRCISIGPFRDVSEAARAATTLRAGGYGPRQRVAEGDVWAGVWVFLPRPDTRAASDQLLAKIKSAGIEDALEMPGPNDSPVISLGLFSEPKRAQTLVTQVQTIGLKPQIVDRKRTGNVYWVDLDLKATDGLLNPADLRGEAGRIVRLEVKSCPAPSASPSATS